MEALPYLQWKLLSDRRVHPRNGWANKITPLACFQVRLTFFFQARLVHVRRTRCSFCFFFPPALKFGAWPCNSNNLPPTFSHHSHLCIRILSSFSLPTFLVLFFIRARPLILESPCRRQLQLVNFNTKAMRRTSHTAKHTHTDKPSVRSGPYSLHNTTSASCGLHRRSGPLRSKSPIILTAPSFYQGHVRLARCFGAHPVWSLVASAIKLRRSPPSASVPGPRSDVSPINPGDNARKTHWVACPLGHWCPSRRSGWCRPMWASKRVRVR